MKFIFCSKSFLLAQTLVFLMFGSLLNAQNPFDVQLHNQPTPGELMKEDYVNETAINSQDNFSSNPFDVDKTAIKEKSQPESQKQSKQDVNDIQGHFSLILRFIILIVLLSIFVFSRNINQKSFNSLLASFTNQAQLRQFRNSLNSFLNLQLSILYLFFFFNAAYFIFLASVHGHWDAPFEGVKLFITLFILIFGIYFIKYISLWLIGYAFEIKRAIPNHLFSTSVHNIVLGFGLFANNAFFAFAKGGTATFLMYFGLGVIALVYLWRQIRGFTFLTDIRQFSVFHFFLYLCACEISPILVGIKLITG